MSIPMYGSIGAFFNRLGKLGLVASQLRSYQNSQLTNMTDTTNGVVAQFNAESDIQALMGGSYIGILDGSGGIIGGTMQSIAEATANRMVFRDNPQLNQTLTQVNTLSSLFEIIRQMKVQGATVLQMGVSASTGSFTGTGNGVMNVSVNRPLDGLLLENAFAETLTLTCTDDSYTGGATAGNESFSVTGEGTQSDPFSFNWPLGSNCANSLNAIDGSQDDTSGNLLTNSNFEDWTASVPDKWGIVTGASTVAKETTIVYDGSACLRITGDGSTLTQIRQRFNNSSGTNGQLSPQNQYSFCLFIRRDGTAPAAGVLTVDLADSSGVVINDLNGVPNSFTIDLTTLTTVFTGYVGAFRTPVILPSTSYIRLRLSTALTNNRAIYIDRASLGLMTQAYTSGPFVAVHSGSTPFVDGDYGYLTVNNTRGSGGTLNTFQTLAARLFFSYIYGNELLLPSSATPSVSDTLIG